MNVETYRDRRVFARRRVLQVTSTGYEQGVRLLAAAVVARFGPAAATIGIANGGLDPARAIGALLRVPVYQVNARHNRTPAAYTQATGQVSCDVRALARALAAQPAPRLTGHVVLVDDIYGTGATIAALRPALTPYLTRTATVRTVVLCRNTGAVGDPDLWLWNVDDWVRFPWEAAPPDGTTVEDLPIPAAVQPT